MPDAPSGERSDGERLARVGAGLRWATAALARAGVPSPRVDAELLLAHVLGLDRGEVRRLAVLDAAMPGAPTVGAEAVGGATGGDTTGGGDGERDVAGRFAALVARRAAREPLQHLVGTAPFRHLELEVGPGVFVPRPETEQVAQAGIDEAARVVAARGDAVVVDLCTGSGAIALALATEVPGAQVHAVELDAAAHAWAARNVAAVTGAAGAPAPVVRLVRGDARRALAELDGTVDVVVSNPPYVPPDAVPREPEVAGHDPAVALYGLGPDGLEVPRGVTAAAARLLRPGGLYVMEHAEVQDAAARAMVDAAEAGGARAFTDARTVEDLTGRPRMVVARRRSATTTPASTAATATVEAADGAPDASSAVPDLGP
ncbi:peptide chain release factor N(5)-glutamine methyltransferase [Isoptericola hypogeus]|uniref:peptide chain release factor N(5)-glutamine methyltransferase n=1 Tax=Isoptericola hypogeus TaxID=300179 RepID=A0ABP4UQ38_9MICO